MIRVEFAKQLPRTRTYVLLGLMAAFPVLLTLVIRLGNSEPSDGGGRGFVELAPESGLNMALATLAHIGPIILPIVAAFLAGAAIAEEANWRTLGYLLLRPVSRGGFLTAKLTVVTASVIVLAVVASSAAVVAGVAAFGWQQVELPSGDSISASTGIWRIAIATPYMAWSLAGIVAFAFMASTFTNASLNAVAAAFALTVISQVLDSFTALGSLRSLLPTHYLDAWEDLFAPSVQSGALVKGTLLQLPYVMGFLTLAWWLFRRKDILT